MSQDNSDVVVDRGAARLDDLWRKEDYWAIWIGFFIIAVAIFLVFSNRSGIEAKYNEYAAIINAEKAKPIKTIELINAQAAQKAIQGQKLPAMKALIDVLKTPARWKSNPLEALYLSDIIIAYVVFFSSPVILYEARMSE